MRLSSLLVLVTALLLLSVGLADGQVQGEEKVPRVILIGGGPVGSMDNMLAVAVSSVVNKHNKDQTRMEVRSFVGPTAWHNLLQSGEIDFGITNPIDAYRAYHGLFEYQEQTGGKGYNDHLVALGPEAYLAMMVRADSPFRAVADLKGKRVSWDFGGHIAAKVDTEALLANGGLTMDDVQTVPVANVNDGVKALVQKRVDATMEVLVAGVVKEADVRIGVRFLPVDPSPEAVKRMQEKFPGCYAVEVAPGDPGSGVLKSKQHCLGFRKPLIVRGNLSEDAVYLVTKTLYENYKDLWPFHPMLKMWNADAMADPSATIPYHPGAIKFYQQAGEWTSEMKKRQEELRKE